MKKSLIYALAAIFMAAAISISCTKEQKEKASEMKDEAVTELDSKQNEVSDELEAKAVENWDAIMDMYHEVMSNTFHPAEEGDLQPLKDRYKEFITISQKWVDLPIPAKYKEKGLPEMLKKLASASQSLGKVVENGSDEDMTKTITALHDVYHDVVGACTDEH